MLLTIQDHATDSYPVEASGWDSAQSFFVEKSELKWDEISLCGLSGSARRRDARWTATVPDQSNSAELLFERQIEITQENRPKSGWAPTLEGNMGVGGESVLFQLTCSRSVPQWEEGEGYWTEMGQRMRLEERFRPTDVSDCTVIPGKPRLKSRTEE